MSLTERIQALTAYSNEVTSASDSTLSEAIATLANGYGNPAGSADWTYDASAGDLTQRIQALINYSNTITGASDSTLSECVATLIAGYGQQETWDYEWDYTQGLLSSNGWTSYINGTASETLDDSGVLLTSSSNSYVRLTAPTETMTTGVAEIIFKIVTIPNNGNCFRASLSNGSNGIQITTPTNGSDTATLCLLNSTNSKYHTKLTPLTIGEWYTLRLVMDTSTSAVYLDGTLLKDNISNSSIKYCTGNRLWEQTDDTEGSTLIQSVKYKINRLS